MCPKTLVKTSIALYLRSLLQNVTGCNSLVEGIVGNVMSCGEVTLLALWVRTTCLRTENIRLQSKNILLVVLEACSHFHVYV